ncbi:ribosomal protein L1 [Mollisia scopiformis]|uniref:Ribosomal protein L1 n=1 Tax=Mollisia scopiformis TaxID=149040 RepID=A0A194XBB2_MOLSC|nr:ribosomal protein L1 [Mollisia scopiformis]KUJ17047.1 ribosomal protein L1 [Mollisia scopiformis]
MAPSTALTTKVEGDPPYQLNSEQTLKASKALLSHIQSSAAELTKSSGKQSLLPTEDDDEEADDSLSTPIWLTLTTKKHITDTKRLKPSRITVPHPLNSSTSTTICLIVADPQRTYKDIVSSPAFPPELAARITKVVGLDKIKKKWTQYEAQRKLMAEHDIFLADDRIIVSLPKLLGKTFYKSTTKRPIPVNIAAPAPKTDGKRIARAKGDTETRGAGTAKQIASEVEKAVSCALVHLSPSTNTAVRVGYSSWSAEKLAENIEAVTKEVVDKFVPRRWRGVRALHIKGPETAALPIWLADELWVDEGDVLGEEEVKAKAEKAANVGKKRKSAVLEGVVGKEGKKLKESNDDALDKEIALRKEKLRKQKEEASKDVEGEVPIASVKVSKKGKKSHGVVA